MKKILTQFALLVVFILSWNCHAKDTVTLAFTGDIMMGTNYPDSDYLIAYSLGNFCTPYRVRLVDQLAYAPVLEATINLNGGTFVHGKIHSFIQTKGVGPRKDASDIVAARIRYLTEVDFPGTNLAIAKDGRIERKNKTPAASELHHHSGKHPVNHKDVSASHESQIFGTGWYFFSGTFWGFLIPV